MWELELLNRWIAAFVAGLDAELGKDAKAKVMEYCGRSCAFHLGSIDAVKKLQSNIEGIDALLDGLNRLEGFWCGSWTRDGDVFCSICETCGCPLIRAGLVELSPTFCQCSRGWVKAVFETALGRPVEVELEQAIGRGDHVCKYIVLPSGQFYS